MFINKDVQGDNDFRFVYFLKKKALVLKTKRDDDDPMSPGDNREERSRNNKSYLVPGTVPGTGTGNVSKLKNNNSTVPDGTGTGNLPRRSIL